MLKPLTPDDEENIDDDKTDRIKPKEFTIGDAINDAMNRAKNSEREFTEAQERATLRDEADDARLFDAAR